MEKEQAENGSGGIVTTIKSSKTGKEVSVTDDELNLTSRLISLGWHSEIKTEDIMGRYNFNDNDRLRVSRELADAMKAREDKEAEFEVVKRELKNAIDILKATEKALGEKLRNDHEQRYFTCFNRVDVAAKKVFYYDVRTARMIKERPAEPRDLQMQIDD